MAKTEFKTQTDVMSGATAQVVRVSSPVMEPNGERYAKYRPYDTVRFSTDALAKIQVAHGVDDTTTNATRIVQEAILKAYGVELSNVDLSRDVSTWINAQAPTVDATENAPVAATADITKDAVYAELSSKMYAGIKRARAAKTDDNAIRAKISDTLNAALKAKQISKKYHAALMAELEQHIPAEVATLDFGL